MRLPAVRKLAFLLALACVAGQPLLPLAAAILADGFHAGEHAHVAEVLPVGGRLRVVLSHEEREAHHRHPASREAVSDADHVLAPLAGDATTPARSAPVVPAPALAEAPSLPLPRAIAAHALRTPEPRARDATGLRTVVLRL